MARFRRARTAEATGETRSLDEILTPAPDEGDGPRRASGAGVAAVFRSNRTLWIVAVAAVLSLVAGLLLGRFLVSPADAASTAEPPALRVSTTAARTAAPRAPLTVERPALRGCTTVARTAVPTVAPTARPTAARSE